jgi:hypothetical protein
LIDSDNFESIGLLLIVYYFRIVSFGVGNSETGHIAKKLSDYFIMVRFESVFFLREKGEI